MTIIPFLGFSQNNGNKAQKIIDKAVEAHGGQLYHSAHYSFLFRENLYTFKNNNNQFYYTKKVIKDNNTFLDELNNGQLSRTKNGDPMVLSEKDMKSAKGAINSVVYFVMLPFKLNDKAVNKTYIEQTIIKNKTYDVIGVTFKKEGGGDDYDDVFHYWINTTTNKIDYLAYKYHVNGGGVRFRRAYNVRNIDGIIFQDYVNYKAKKDVVLRDLPTLFEDGKLKELSKIKTEHIINLKKQ
jgi:hypothetical protein